MLFDLNLMQIGAEKVSQSLKRIDGGMNEELMGNIHIKGMKF